MEENFVVNEELLDLISQCHDTVQRYVSFLEKKIGQQEKRIASCLKDKRSTHRDVGVQVPGETAEPEPSDKEQNDEKEEVVTNIVEDIKQLSDATNQLGERFLYEKTTGLYYDTACGYYYDAKHGLYYDGATGTYFSYNYETGKYELVQQQTPEEPQRRRRKARRRIQPNETSVEDEDKSEKKTEENEPKEEGEISERSESESSYLSTPVASPFSPIREETAWEEGSVDFYKLATDNPPCVRIIVQSCKSNPEMAGMFSIIPYTGGEIGRSNSCLVSIDDELLEDVHIKTSYDETEKIYKMVNLGVSAVTINGKTLLASDPAVDLVHGSIIEVGSSKLLIHIHRGAETCGHCEPGLIKVEKEEPKKNTVGDVKSKDNQRRKEIQRLKEKYGIQKPIEKVEIPEGYEDKAEARRKKHGVDYVNAKVETASVHVKISENNKGFKMLARMGWNSGEGVGKKQGIAEPVTVEVRHSKVGLGAVDYATAPQTFKQKQKRENLLKTKERFDKLPEKIDEHSDKGDGVV